MCVVEKQKKKIKTFDFLHSATSTSTRSTSRERYFYYYKYIQNAQISTDPQMCVLHTTKQNKYMKQIHKEALACLLFVCSLFNGTSALFGLLVRIVSRTGEIKQIK